MKSTSFTTYMEFLDFGPTQFHGIEFTLQDGSTQFVEPHPEVKEEVESLLGRMKIPTAIAQMESHNKQKAMKEGSKIYRGSVINSLRRFTGEEHLYADGWRLHDDQSLTDAQIKEHNLAAYTEFYGSKEQALEIINR